MVIGKRKTGWVKWAENRTDEMVKSIEVQVNVGQVNKIFIVVAIVVVVFGQLLH